jgi:hypothetical protein
MLFLIFTSYLNSILNTISKFTLLSKVKHIIKYLLNEIQLVSLFK